MKSVLISIQPKWCELIASGKKKVEVRKTRPKIDTPFKCYIYQTKMKWIYDILFEMKLFSLAHKLLISKGKVIGEFICDDINTTDVVHSDEEVGWYVNNMHAVKGSCLDEYDILNYCPKEATIYGWHISDLVIYDKPKELNEFYRWTDYDDSKNDKRPCSYCEHNAFDYSENCEYCAIDYDGEHCVHLQMKRPPQSWCYVEKGGGTNA